MKYKTFTDALKAKQAQILKDTARRKEKRQQQLGIFPFWKAETVIEILKQRGYTFDEAFEALQDVIQAQGLRLRADQR